MNIKSHQYDNNLYELFKIKIIKIQVNCDEYMQ